MDNLTASQRLSEGDPIYR